jgi:hypothetical protein
VNGAAEQVMAPAPHERHAILATECRKALAAFVPNCPGNRYNGQQIAAAKGIARRRALAIIDAACVPVRA